MYLDNNIDKFPFYSQIRDNDCGFACLKMICSFYQIPFDKIDQQCKFPLSEKGLSVYDLLELLKLLGFNHFLTDTQCSPLLFKATLPCLMLWGGNHFIVIYEFRVDKLLIADPASGLEWIDAMTFYKHCQRTKGEWIILLEPKN